MLAANFARSVRAAVAIEESFSKAASRLPSPLAEVAKPQSGLIEIREAGRWRIALSTRATMASAGSTAMVVVSTM